jgi:hypothetical protein
MRLSGGFERRPELSLVNSEEPISNQLWSLMERFATKDFFEGNRIDAPWTPQEDERLIQDWLAVGRRWKFLEKKRATLSASQLKNRSYLNLRRCLHKFEQ